VSVSDEYEQLERQRDDAVEATPAEAQRPPALPRIYVASLSDYNAGRLHGDWISAAQEPDEIETAVKAMLAMSPEQVAEEWAIHDYEGFGPLELSEWESFEIVSRLGLSIEQHGQAFAAFASLVDGEVEQLDRFEQIYRGEWDSVEAYADHWLDEVGATEILNGIPEWLQPYVSLDSSSFARDLVLGGDIQTVEKPNGGVWIFEGNW
jgi:antirestriction protein